MTLLTRTGAVMARRQVLWTLVVRDLKVRYSRSVLGYLWTILDPLAMAGVYFFVFTFIFKARKIGEQPYILFLIAGLLAWQWFSGSLTDTSRALLAEAKLVRSTNLPRELWVVRVVIAKGIEFLLSLPVLAGFTLFYIVKGQTHVSWGLLFIPVGFVLQFFLLVGIGLLLAPVTALVTDTQRVVRIFLRMFFYLTPVIYGVHAAPKRVRVLLELNPMTGVMELYRAGLFAREVNWESVAVGSAVTVLIIAAGAIVFARLERAVLKEI
ncbi:ABC transporter permease [Oryzihumus sp.]|jgi:ABC-2 type transport system permease protein|uniref:ABC transporter permease n=1 Tax=Oryzihumus sp. TaxID=1968903 RepID=UPI002EDA0E6C